MERRVPPILKQPLWANARRRVVVEENESSVESGNIEAITPFDDLLNGECSAERLYLDIYAPERLNFLLERRLPITEDPVTESFRLNNLNWSDEELIEQVFRVRLLENELERLIYKIADIALKIFYYEK